MAVNYCLPPQDVQKFVKALREGKVNPFELEKKTSAERREFFKDIVGEYNAEHMNTLFESKMLLKRRSQGYATWASKLTGISKETRRDLFAKIQRMDTFLDTSANQAFLEDLAAQRLGIAVTKEEAQEIANRAKKVREAEEEVEKRLANNPENKKLKNWDWKKNKVRRDLGYARADLKSYVDDKKLKAEKLGVVKSLKKEPLKTVAKPLGASRAFVASADVSFAFRQGWKMMLSHPSVWARNTGRAIYNVPKDIRGKTDVAREYDARMMSDPYFDLAQKSKLALLNLEEAIPSSAPQKIPGLGRVFRASETSFSGAIQMQRMELFSRWAQAQEVASVSFTSPEGKVAARNFAKFVNAHTGRGDFGSIDHKMDLPNKIFFSPRLWKSHLDTLTFYQLHKDMTAKERRTAALEATKVYAGTVLILGLLKAMFGDASVEEDPRSSDFGKLKIGNTRFDLSGGLAGLITLASRQINGKYKSATSGEVIEYGNKYGEQSRWDALLNYMENKLSPVGQVVKQIEEGKDFDGDSMNLLKVVEGLLVPLGIKNVYSNDDPHSANKLLIGILDAFGISSNTYGASMSTSWVDSDSKQMTQFKEKYGEDKVKEAFEEYSRRYAEWYKANESRVKNEPENQGDILSTAKEEIKKKVIDDFGFEYEREKSQKQSKQEKAELKNRYGL